MSALGYARERAASPPFRQRGTTRAQALHRAIHGLALAHPEFSARTTITRRQAWVLAIAVFAVVAALAVQPRLAVPLFVFLISIGFVCSMVLRTVLALIGRKSAHAGRHKGGSTLPVYTVLLPLYREAGILEQLSQAMESLDYPRDKLDLKYIVEEDDLATREAAEKLGLREIVVVPPGSPRTKPKACNYALQFARGSHLVIFDAEDRPDPDQLRKAAAAFAADPGTACFQARLAIDNAADGWIARMFALDYAVWFRTLLPGLARLRAPIPLGGTSNHFRTDVLIRAGGWDPYNVTEDADLGLRLAALGHRVAMLDSTTVEAAPVDFRVWLRQRTRWIKGYMQTLLVHTRHPVAFASKVGPRGCFIVQSFLGGAIWSALVNPLLWLLFVAGSMLSHGEAGAINILARLSGGTLLIANGLLAALSVIEPHGRANLRSLTAIFSYPIYWMLISLAAYRALWQLVRNPFCWEKTPHGNASL